MVAVGQCAEALGQGEPYLAILEALSSLLAQQPTLQSDLRRVAPTWLSQMPWHVPLEEREADELLDYAGTRVAPPVEAFNPVFDVTPADLIDVIVTERGIVERPDTAKLAQLMCRKRLH